MSANLIIPMIRLLKPTHSESFLTVADNLLLGAMVLEAAPPTCPPHALAMLCAHSLECILKAYIVRSDHPEVLKWARKEGGHDIEQLWNKALLEGLIIESPIPDWAQRLGGLHGSPFILRYARGTNPDEGFHGTSFPILKGLPKKLSEIADKVRIELQKIPR